MTRLDGERTTRLMRGLASLQHLLLLVLLVVGAVQGWRGGTSPAAVVAVSVAFVLWYVAGVRRSGRHGALLAVTPRSRRVPTPIVVWLAGLIGLWVVAVLVSPAFVWVAFGLWLLVAHLLPLALAAVSSLVVLMVVVGAPLVAGHPWSVGGVVGPSIGALFAVALARGQVLLARDSLERARLMTSLVRAHEETAALHDELLVVQREAGVLAERARLSRDIHDTLAQGFSSIVLLARGADVTADEAGLRRILHRVETTAVENLAEARRVVGALAPAALEGGGLAGALRRLLGDLETDTGVKAELRVDPSFPALGSTEEVVLLRTAQGALANVRRHARAGRVVVSLVDTDGQVRLDVVDDGVGFDVARSGARAFAGTPEVGGGDLSRGGYGLVSTRARLHELGGGLVVESAPGEGTAVSAYLPWPTREGKQP